MVKLISLIILTLVLTACNTTEVYQKAAEVNDTAAAANITSLCTVNYPALIRKYSNEPEKLAALTVICSPSPTVPIPPS